MGFLRFLLSIYFIRQLFFIGLSSAMLFFLISFSLNVYTKHNNYQIVPDFEGIQISELSNLIDKENLRFEVIDSSRFDDLRKL